MIVSLSFPTWRLCHEKENRNEQRVPYLAIHAASDYVRLAKRTLDYMCWMGTGPMFRKHGGRIFYHIDKLKKS